MKAMILPEFGAPLRLATVPVPKIGPNDVLLRVRATGVGLTVVIMTRVPGRVTSFPRIPGHEVAGEVVELGAEVAHVKVGVHAVQMAKLSGGWVLAADITDDKLAAAKDSGADELIDVRRGDLVTQVAKVTGGRGVDAAIDFVGSRETLDGSLRSLARAGR